MGEVLTDNLEMSLGQRSGDSTTCGAVPCPSQFGAGSVHQAPHPFLGSR